MHLIEPAIRVLHVLCSPSVECTKDRVSGESNAFANLALRELTDVAFPEIGVVFIDVPRLTEIEDIIVFVGDVDEAFAHRESGARHTLKNGNEMTALAYVTDNEAIWWRGFKDSEGGIKQKATRWKIDGETVEEARLELLQLSANGKLTKSQSDFTTLSHCSGCSAISDGWLHHEACTDYDLVCLSACSACSTVKSCTPCLVACVGTWCAWLLDRCCNNYKNTCVACR
ncbi:hypothetical protein ACNS7O_12805 [Haloferacaceae archaeon DSL9]